VWSKHWRRTVDAVVGGVEVGGEVLGTRLNASPQTRHGHLAPRAAGAGRVQQVDDVGRAADEAVVARDAAAEPLTAVSRLVDDDQLTVGTRRVERLELAVLTTVCTRTSIDVEKNVFTARRRASAVYSVVVCLSVRLSQVY